MGIKKQTTRSARAVNIVSQAIQLRLGRPPAGSLPQSLFFRGSNFFEPKSQVYLQLIVVSREFRTYVVDLWNIEAVLAGHDARSFSAPAGDQCEPSAG